MRKVSRATIYGLAGLSVFGIVFDSGLFKKWLGKPDGHDHGIGISVTSSTAAAQSAVVMVQNNTIGDDIPVIPPRGPGIVGTDS